jgi:PTS system nitrogen regulatory IIA component
VSIVEILSPDRVSVSSETEGIVRDKPAALERLARMLASGQGEVDAHQILEVLSERERLQSTGVGGGVAVPHGAVTALQRQIGALLVCPRPIEFDAIDGAPVNILFALVGPKGAPAEHLKILARVSRLLREAGFRQRLAQAQTGSEAYELISTSERGAP